KSRSFRSLTLPRMNSSMRVGSSHASHSASVIPLHTPRWFPSSAAMLPSSQTVTSGPLWARGYVMPRKKPPRSGKLRAGEPVIGDLAGNHVERQALLGNGTIERIVHDYGLDLILFTYTAAGEVEPGNVYFQVKATERLKWLSDGTTAAFRVERSDLVG